MIIIMTTVMIVVMVMIMIMIIIIISNGNWTEWSTIQAVIVRVIARLDEREADMKLRARVLPELYDTRSNY